MINLRQLSKAYATTSGSKVIFENVDLEIPSDGRIAVLGLRGSGKSTFLRLLAGLERPTGGAIDRGVSVSLPVGYARGFKPGLSARQNATFFAECYGANVGEVVDFVMHVTEMSLEFDKPLYTMLGEMRLQFAFALSYAIPFDTYLIDNTLGAGSPKFREKCLAMFAERSKAAGIVFATSEPRVAQRYCDTAVIVGDRNATFYPDIADALAAFEKVRQDLV